MCERVVKWLVGGMVFFGEVGSHKSAPCYEQRVGGGALIEKRHQVLDDGSVCTWAMEKSCAGVAGELVELKIVGEETSTSVREGWVVEKTE